MKSEFTKSSLLVTTNYPPKIGGMEEFYFRVARHVPNIAVCTPRVAGWREADRTTTVPILRPPFERYSGRKFFWVLVWWCYAFVMIVKHQARFLHCGNVTPTGYVGLWAKQFLGLPYSLFFHGMDVERAAGKQAQGGVRGRTNARILDEAELVFANSADTARRLEELGVPEHKLTVVNPGVDAERFQPDVAEKPSRQRKRLLTVGRFARRKGIHCVLRALPRVLNEVDLEFTIVGREQEENLRALVSELGLERHVHFEGEVSPDALPEFFRAADLFVMPAYEEESSGSVEGFGIVFLEAAASGIAVIGGRSGGISDAVVDKETGYLVDPHDEDELVARIVALLTNDELRQKMGERARERVLRDFSWEAFGRRIEEAMTRVLERKASPLV